MKKTLAILGSHPRTTETFNFERKDCEIWILNEAHNKPEFSRFDAVFQLHVEPIWRNPKNRNDPNHINWLKNIEAVCNKCDGTGTADDKPCDACEDGTYKPTKRDGVTVYMQQAFIDVPGSVAFPMEEVKAMLSPYSWEWKDESGSLDMFSSSIPYAIALGIHQGYRRIELHGIELETNTEYMYQRDGMTFWKGFAVGQGVDLVHYTPQYRNKKLYGFEGEAKLELSQFEDRIAELKPIMESMKPDYERIAQEADKALVHFMQTGEGAENVADTFKKQIKMAHEVNLVHGALQENEKYLAKAKAMMEASEGRFQFSRQEFEAARQGAQMEHSKFLNAANLAAGAADTFFAEARKIKNLQKRRKKMKDFAAAAREYLKQSMHVGVWQGVGSENNMLLSIVDELVKAAGGEKSEQVFLDMVKQHA